MAANGPLPAPLVPNQWCASFCPLEGDLWLDWWVRCRWLRDKISEMAFTRGCWRSRLLQSEVATAHSRSPEIREERAMNLLVLLIILLLVFGGGGYYAGGPRIGGSLGGLILLIIIILLLTGRLRL